MKIPNSNQMFGRLENCEELALYPCIWIGSSFNRKIEDWCSSRDKRHVGQFQITHQFQGACCEHIDLSGIFLPLSFCSDLSVAQHLGRFEVSYSDVAYDSQWPTLEILDAIRRDLKPIEFISIDRTFRNVKEAFVPFHLDAGVFDKMSKIFKYVQAVEISRESLKSEILSSERIKFKTIDRLANWLDFDVHSLAAAFLYANSD